MSRRAWVKFFVIVLMGMLIAFVVVSGNEKAALQTKADQRAAARMAVGQIVPKLLTYSTTGLATQINGAQRYLTQRFQPQFASVQRALIEPAVKQSDLSTTATITNQGLVSQNGETVTVLVFLTQTTKKNGAAEGTPTSSRALVTMKLVGGQWLVDNLAPV